MEPTFWLSLATLFVAIIGWYKTQDTQMRILRLQTLVPVKLDDLDRFKKWFEAGFAFHLKTREAFAAENGQKIFADWKIEGFTQIDFAAWIEGMSSLDAV